MAEQKNPFDKLGKQARPVRSSSSKKSSKDAAPEVEETEEVLPGEEETPESLEAEDSKDDSAEEEPKKQPAPKKQAASKSTRRTAKQVEAEYAEKQAEMQAQIESLQAKLGQSGNDIGVVEDRVVLEDGIGGDVRVVADGKTLTNDDWRVTVDGLRLIMGRASSQATQTFVIPAKLAESLGEVLSQLSEVKKFRE